MRRAHDMPFGAVLCADGGVAFRLWAPGARRIDVRLAGSAARTIPMTGPHDGWYAARSDTAGAGTLYQFVIDGELVVPDPASRFQPRDVHGPSEVVDPAAFDWHDTAWRGRPWHETVLYELHVGTFTPAGTYGAAAARLDYLADLGITAVELMPLGECPGARNWGYDGVLLFAPEHTYGRPEDLKAFVQAAHDRGLMVFVDVVYNHFGPEGNHLHRYAPQFFTERHATPWGAAIDFDGPHSRTVRDFFIHNALYWIEEFHVDGLRLDAVHAIHDDSRPDILTELAAAVHHAAPDRHVHLVLENDDNTARNLERDAAGTARAYAAQWNDDVHHVLHVLTTGETGGYYADHAAAAPARLGRTLAEGFDYQGEHSPHRGRRRGQPSAHLPPTAFVSFLQNHDQIGNRAMGERIGSLAPAEALRAAVAIVLLSPSIPLLFMGEEWNAPQPFVFFCDVGPALADAVREGRRREFAHFPAFADEAAHARIPDPLTLATYESAKLDWSLLSDRTHGAWLDHHRSLLAIRRREIVPRLAGVARGNAQHALHGGKVVEVRWWLREGAVLQLLAWLGAEPIDGLALRLVGRTLHSTAPGVVAAEEIHALPPWFVSFSLAVPAGTG
jgi:malto-oligosyltrehalose trehalohydrolase